MSQGHSSTFVLLTTPHPSSPKLGGIVGNLFEPHPQKTKTVPDIYVHNFSDFMDINKILRHLLRWTQRLRDNKAHLHTGHQKHIHKLIPHLPRAVDATRFCARCHASLRQRREPRKPFQNQTTTTQERLPTKQAQTRLLQTWVFGKPIDRPRAPREKSQKLNERRLP